MDMETLNKTALSYNPVSMGHFQPGHPERPERMQAVLDELEQNGLMKKLVQIPQRHATKDEIMLVHTLEHFIRAQEYSQAGLYLDPDTYTTEATFESAMTVVGCTLDVVKTVISGKADNGFVLVRPPGHHSLSDRAMGFCVFNSIAIAAQFALEQPSITKVAIVDFDMHHGNGTQSIHQENPDVLFVSSHAYPFYPGTGAKQETGRNGSVINCPLPAGIGDETFIAVYSEIVIPALYRFQPDLILVSAGYDAHWDDQLGPFQVSLQGLYDVSLLLTKAAQELCNNKIVLNLEGGYNLDVLAHGVSNSIRVLLGEEEKSDPIGQPEQLMNANFDLDGYINEIKQIHNL
jgi:acetoin utilization deacetylase AcuC-like enzyme